ncbi:MAG: hypothetical protein LHV68_04785 [Elusimicrobia bacterium]|nr:hypothetical protein [Candidatus Liberimonas magnetica]
MEKTQLIINIYGITLKIDSNFELISRLKRDFSYFLNTVTKPVVQKTYKIDIIANLQKPPYDILPKNKIFIKKEDLSWHELNEKRFIDYNGKALSIYDYKNDKCEIFSDELDLLHELVYLLIHSRTGEILDKHGVHRVHALGVSYKGKGLLCLLPQGGGKTTLCLELLKNDKIKLLSDDTPLITDSRQILPFPLRIGLSQDSGSDIPEAFQGKMIRRKFGPKTLIDIAFFKDKISQSVPVSVLLVGKRINSSESKIIKINRLSAVIPLFKNCILGIGIAQMLEYFIRFNIKDIISKVEILVSRLTASLSLLMNSRVYIFNIGTDTSKNALLLLDYLDNLP